MPNFGEKFFDRLNESEVFKKFISTSSTLKVTYADRFGSSPLVCSLLIKLMESIHARSPVTSLRIETAYPKEQGGSGDHVCDLLGENLEGHLETFVTTSKCPFTINLWVSTYRDIAHTRTLKLESEKGCLVLYFDQGFAFWTVRRNYPRNWYFDGDRGLQDILSEHRIKIKGDSHRTIISIKLENE